MNMPSSLSEGQLVRKRSSAMQCCFQWSSVHRPTCRDKQGCRCPFLSLFEGCPSDDENRNSSLPFHQRGRRSPRAGAREGEGRGRMAGALLYWKTASFPRRCQLPQLTPTEEGESRWYKRGQGDADPLQSIVGNHPINNSTIQPTTSRLHQST